MFWNAQDHPRQIHKAALGQQVALFIHKATSQAVQTSLANLDAAQETS
jgi:hypothetical protein